MSYLVRPGVDWSSSPAGDTRRWSRAWNLVRSRRILAVVKRIGVVPRERLESVLAGIRFVIEPRDVDPNVMAP